MPTLSSNKQKWMNTMKRRSLAEAKPGTPGFMPPGKSKLASIVVIDMYVYSYLQSMRYLSDVILDLYT